MDLHRRSTQAELMDDAVTSFEEFHECLGELETINRWTIAYRPTLRWLSRIRKEANGPMVVLDIGSGGGDMLRRIWQRFPSGMELTGVDINPWSKQAAALQTPHDAPIHYETCDIFSFDAERRAEAIISSLFTHHLSDEQLVKFLRWMEQHATFGWFINDLHRHPLPYHFIRWATRLLSSNRLIRHDAAVSVARAFTRADWVRLLEQAGIPRDQTRIRWALPFRYCVERRKP